MARRASNQLSQLGREGENMKRALVVGNKISKFSFEIEIEILNQAKHWHI